MESYFKDSYKEYYNAYSNTALVDENVNLLTSTIDGIKTELSGINSLFSELSGSYSGELDDSVQSIFEMVSNLSTVVDSGLQSAVTSMKQLGTDLKDLKEKDDKYKEYQTRRDNNSQYKNLENKKDPGYLRYHDAVNDINEIVPQLKKLVTSVENSISTIKSFSDSIIDIRMQISSFNYASSFTDFDNFANLPLEKQQEIIADLIAKMSERYNYYKEEYEQYSRFYENMTDEQLEAFQSILNGLRFIDYDAIWDFRVFDNDFMDPITRGMTMLDWLDQFEATNMLEVVDNYLNKGQGWVESGMADLAFAFWPGGGNLFTADAEELQNDLREHGEDYFWNNVSDTGDYTRDDKSRLNQDFQGAMQQFKSDCAGFKETFTKAGNAVIAIQGLKEINKTIEFDSYFASDDFKNFTSQWGQNPDFMKSPEYKNIKGYSPKHKDYYSWMSLDERKMLEYLYNKDPSLAEKYVGSLSTSFNRREGYYKAKQFYDTRHEGSNEWLDAVRDHVSYNFEGFDLGVDSFVTGLTSLVDPDSEYSVNDYFNMATVNLLSKSDDPYDKGLLLSYNLGSTAGEAIIPTVVGLISPPVGVALSAGSEFGNDMRSLNIKLTQEGENVSYGELVRDVGMNTIAKKGYEALTKGLPTKWVLDAFTDGMFTPDQFHYVLSEPDVQVLTGKYYEASNGGRDYSGYGLGGDKTQPYGSEKTFSNLIPNLVKGAKGQGTSAIKGALNEVLGNALGKTNLSDEGKGIVKEVVSPFINSASSAAANTVYKTAEHSHQNNVQNGRGIKLTEADGSEIKFEGSDTILGIIEAPFATVDKVANTVIPRAAAEEGGPIAGTTAATSQAATNSASSNSTSSGTTATPTDYKQDLQQQFSTLQQGESVSIHGQDGERIYVVNDDKVCPGTYAVLDVDGRRLQGGLTSSEVITYYAADPESSNSDGFNAAESFVSSFGDEMLGSGSKLGKGNLTKAGKSAVSKHTSGILSDHY